MYVHAEPKIKIAHQILARDSNAIFHKHLQTKFEDEIRGQNDIPLGIRLPLCEVHTCMYDKLKASSLHNLLDRPFCLCCDTGRHISTLDTALLKDQQITIKCIGNLFTQFD